MQSFSQYTESVDRLQIESTNKWLAHANPGDIGNLSLYIIVQDRTEYINKTNAYITRGGFRPRQPETKMPTDFIRVNISVRVPESGKLDRSWLERFLARVADEVIRYYGADEFDTVTHRLGGNILIGNEGTASAPHYVYTGELEFEPRTSQDHPTYISISVGLDLKYRLALGDFTQPIKHGQYWRDISQALPNYDELVQAGRRAI